MILRTNVVEQMLAKNCRTNAGEQMSCFHEIVFGEIVNLNLSIIKKAEFSFQNYFIIIEISSYRYLLECRFELGCKIIFTEFISNIFNMLYISPECKI